MCGDDGNCVQTSSQTRPQPLFAGMPAPTRSTDEERSVQQPDASAPAVLPAASPGGGLLHFLGKTDSCLVQGLASKPVRRCHVLQLGVV